LTARVDVSATRQRVLGIIGVVCGTAILLFGLLSRSGHSSSGSYHVGQVVGLIVGAALLLIGGRAVLKRLRSEDGVQSMTADRSQAGNPTILDSSPSTQPAQLNDPWRDPNAVTGPR